MPSHLLELNNVVESLAFLFHHLVEHGVGVLAEEEEGGNLNALEVVFVAPGFPNGSPWIPANAMLLSDV
ncbi:hypothetical protein, partial [Escherichia coli]|uniref:hypothetical protein n=1 Tax=Escherichia coli TaxID=562 RepID=UPI00202FBB6F